MSDLKNIHISRSKVICYWLYKKGPIRKEPHFTCSHNDHLFHGKMTPAAWLLAGCHKDAWFTNVWLSNGWFTDSTNTNDLPNPLHSWAALSWGKNHPWSGNSQEQLISNKLPCCILARAWVYVCLFMCLCAWICVCLFSHLVATPAIN